MHVPRASRAFRWIGSHSLGTLLALTTVFGALWLVIELADEVGEGDTQVIDERLLLALRSATDRDDPLGPPWVEQAMIDVSALGSTTIYVILSVLVTGYLLMRRNPRAGALLAVAVAGGQAVSWLLKGVLDRPRPDLVEHLSPTLLDGSFPSGHTVMATVTYLTLAAMLCRVHRGRALRAYFLVTAFLLALVVGVSRVYLGVHWPSDVAAGLAAGAGWSSLCWLAARALQRRGQVEPAVETPSPA